MALNFNFVQFVCDQLIEEITKNMASLVKQYTDAVEANFAAVNEKLANIKADIQGLDAKIAELSNTTAALSPEDSALLQGIVDSSTALVASVASVDELTPPPPPAG